MVDWFKWCLIGAVIAILGVIGYSAYSGEVKMEKCNNKGGIIAYMNNRAICINSSSIIPLD